MFFFTTHTPQGTLHRPTSGFRVRKLQRQVYRLAEMLALERKGHTSSKQFRTLRYKVRPIYDNTKSVATNLAAASAELAHLRKTENDFCLQQWRHRLQGFDRECWKWLTKQHSAPNINIADARNAQESLHVLQRHWRDLWDRQVDWQGALAACQPFLPNANPLPNDPVDLDILTAVVNWPRRQYGWLERK